MSLSAAFVKNDFHSHRGDERVHLHDHFLPASRVAGFSLIAAGCEHRLELVDRLAVTMQRAQAQRDISFDAWRRLVFFCRAKFGERTFVVGRLLIVEMNSVFEMQLRRGVVGQRKGETKTRLKKNSAKKKEAARIYAHCVQKLLTIAFRNVAELHARLARRLMSPLGKIAIEIEIAFFCRVFGCVPVGVLVFAIRSPTVRLRSRRRTRNAGRQHENAARVEAAVRTRRGSACARDREDDRLKRAARAARRWQPRSAA